MERATHEELSRSFQGWFAGDRRALDDVFGLAAGSVTDHLGIDFHSIPVRFAANHRAFEGLMAEHFGSFPPLPNIAAANLIHLHVPEPLLPTAILAGQRSADGSVRFPAFGPDALLHKQHLDGGWLLLEDSGTLVVIAADGGPSLLVTVEGENQASGPFQVRQGETRFASRLSPDALLLTLLQEFLAGFQATLLHAACVERSGCGILIMAPEKRGKSTTTLSLVRAGWKMLSDDRTLLRRVGDEVMLHSFPERSRIGVQAVAFFPELAGHVDLPAGEGKAEFSPEAVWGDIRSHTATPYLLVIPEVVDRPSSFAERVQHLDGVDGVNELVADNLLRTAPEATIQRFDLLCRLFASVPMVRLRVGPGVERTAADLDRLMQARDR